MDDKTFKKAVAEYIGWDPVTSKFDERKIAELANRCRCARGTITWWAAGHSSPHPLVQKAVIEFILEQSSKS